MNLFLDYETWSAVNIRRGTDVYMNHAKPLIATYAIDNEPVQLHDFTVDPQYPFDLYNYLTDPGIRLIAHNAYFDRMVTLRLLKLASPINRWHCTQAQAQAHGLPGGLGPLCEVMGVPADKAKDEDGKRLIRKFCGVKPLVKDEEWELFKNYAMLDIEAMRDCYKRMPNWNYLGEEHRLWQIDQNINNRGFQIDMKFADAAVEALKREKGRLDEDVCRLTGGALASANQRDKFLLYICETQGCVLRDLKAPTIREALEDENLDETTKVLLRLRLQSATTSVSKFKRLQDTVGPDGRLRGTLQFAGAGRTSRWAGRIFQPHNLPRPNMKADDIRLCIELIREGKADLVDLIAPLNKACSNGLRGLIIAPEGEELDVADYSSIEGRGLAWSAGEMWKVQAFADGKDMYLATYERAFGLPAGSVSKKDVRRQHGKVMELSMGYGGGVGAFINMAAAYSVDLDELGRVVPPAMKPDVLKKAIETWEYQDEQGMTFGLSRDAYVACDALKIVFRQAHPATVKFWYMLEEAARKVICTPGTREQVGPYLFDCNGKWMRIKLPSGRFLCYALPKVHHGGGISYMSWRNKRWSRTKTYGGKLAENIVQAISRDILGAAILRCEDRGIPVVLHIHDEIIAQRKKSDLKELIAVMTEVPSWARGFPIAAEGFSGTRYEKH
jgi:DNA polymerase bacteriophage-type